MTDETKTPKGAPAEPGTTQAKGNPAVSGPNKGKAKARKGGKDRRKPPRKAKKTPKNSHTSAAEIKKREKMAEALEYRKQGYPYRLIGAEMGIDPAEAFRLVDGAIKEIIREPVEQLVALELDNIDSLMSAYFANASNGDLAALDAVMKLMDKRAKYAGVFAGEKGGSLTVSGGGDVTITFSPADATA